MILAGGLGGHFVTRLAALEPTANRLQRVVEKTYMRPGACGGLFEHSCSVSYELNAHNGFISAGLLGPRWPARFGGGTQQDLQHCPGSSDSRVDLEKHEATQTSISVRFC